MLKFGKKLKDKICFYNARLFNTSPKKSKIKNDKDINNKFYDIIICGGGIVGNAMAVVLGQDNLFNNLKIALIDSFPKENSYLSPKIHANQVCALNNTTIDLLKSIYSWDFIQQHRFGHVYNMHVWDEISGAFISFSKENRSNLAYIVENELILASLKRRLPNFKNVKVFYSNKIDDFCQNNQTIDVKLKDNLNLKAKLLIDIKGSDGGNSFIRNKAKIECIHWNYDQVSIVATMKILNKTENFTAWQRFLSTGPIALLPLNENYSCLVWSIKKELVKNLLEMTSDEFSNKVNHAFESEDLKIGFGSRIHNWVQNGIDFLRDAIPKGNEYFTERETAVRLLPPKVVSSQERNFYPLSFIHSNNYVSKRIALIGDSIHKIHPLAGQGVNIGFGDVVRLKKILTENLLSGNEIGSWKFLKDYESLRQKETFPKIFGIDALDKIYSDYEYCHLPIKKPIIATRTIGLTVSNRLLPLKNFFINQAIK